MGENLKTIKNFYSNMKQSKPILLKICQHIGALITILSYIYFITHPDLYTRVVDDKTEYSVMKIIALAIACIAIILIIYLKNNFSKIINKIAGIVLVGVSPILAFGLMEYATMTELGKMDNKQYILNFIILYALLLVILMITNSLRFTPIILISICVIFAIANSLVYDFRGNPIVAADFASLSTAAGVAGNYTFTIGFREFFIALGAYGISVFALKLKYTKAFHWKVRIAYTIFACLTFVQFCRVFAFSDYLDDVYFKFFNPMVTYRKNGCALTFVRSINFVIVEKPADYSIELVEEIIDKYDTKETQNSNAVKPNIITIVDEAFSELNVLADIKTDVDYMPFFRNLSENCVRGVTYSSVFGGNTANTEFEFLTGNSMALLPPQSVIFELYVKRDISSLASILKADGYVGNIALHPYRARGYNRPVVYPLLGFEQFLSQDDMKGSSRIGSFISDKSSFDRIIEEYEKAREVSSAPFYMYNLTMQNHSAYNRDMTGLEYKVKLSEDQYDKQAETYLNLIKATDEAFEELANYFEAIDEPTVIVFFGDHQPKLPKKFLDKITDGTYSKWTDEELLKKYAVPFVIWANYDIEEKEIEQTSFNYLSTILMDAIGYEKTGYQKFLTELSKKIPVITANGYLGDDGKLYQTSDESSPYYDLVHEYQILQYNNIFDKNNRVDYFFFGS